MDGYLLKNVKHVRTKTRDFGTPLRVFSIVYTFCRLNGRYLISGYGFKQLTYTGTHNIIAHIGIVMWSVEPYYDISYPGKDLYSLCARISFSKLQESSFYQ